MPKKIVSTDLSHFGDVWMSLNYPIFSDALWLPQVTIIILLIVINTYLAYTILTVVLMTLRIF